MIRAVVYARVSTLDQSSDEKVSIPDQIKWAEDLCTSKGWNFIKPYIEPGIKGDSEIESRKAFSELMDDAKKNTFDLLLVYHSSRLAREADIGMRACRLLGNMRKQVYIRNSPIEPVLPIEFYWGSNIGAMYMNAFSFVGDMGENVARGERTRTGASGLARRGVMKSAPYGYVKISKMINDENGRQKYIWNFELDPLKAATVANIFETYAKSGGSLRQLVLKLNKDSIPSPSGTVGLQAWSAATIKNILSNPAYIGMVRWGRKLGSRYQQGKTANGKSKRIYTPADKWILTPATNISGFIDEKIFKYVQEKLKSRGAMKGRAIASQGLLTGKLICGLCNKKGYHKTRTAKSHGRSYIRSDYVCPTYIAYKTCRRYIIAANKIHNIVIDDINKAIADKVYLGHLFDEYKPSVESNNKQLVQIQKAVESLESKKQRIQEAYEGGIYDLKTFAERGKVIDKDLLKAKELLQTASETSRTVMQFEEGKKQFLKYITDWKKEYLKSDFSRQKELIGRIIDKVVIGDNKINIIYRI